MGKGKDKGKDRDGKGSRGGCGKASLGGGGHGFQQAAEYGTIAESEVQLKDDSIEMILELIANLMKARGETVPSGEKKSKKGKQTNCKSTPEDEEELLVPESAEKDAKAVAATNDDAQEADEEQANATDSDDEVVEISKRKARKEEERVKRRLMRQLVQDERQAASEAKKNSAMQKGADVGVGAGDRKRVPPKGDKVRLYLWNELKKHEKPKGPLLFPRGGMDAVREVIQAASAKLNVKTGKKAVPWVYVNGGALNEDPKNEHPTPLENTFQLVDDDIILLSVRAVPSKDTAASVTADGAEPKQTLGGKEAGAKAAPQSSSRAAKTGDEEAAPSAKDSLDAVRAAYASRANAARLLAKASTSEDAASASAALSAAAVAWKADARGNTLRKSRDALPAAGCRAALLEALAASQVVVVSGETGSGKTTQCPHFVLEDFISRGRGGECNIVCTQPRRIAAIGVAERVCQERGEEPGGPVGYAVRLDSRSSAQTRLLFCTTGVLLSELNSDPKLSNVTHVFVDEAHERNLQTDFLLTILRDLLPKRPGLKLILMSATIEKSLFVNYFSSLGAGNVPVVNIPGRTHPVQVRFLHDVQAAIKGRSFSDASTMGTGVDLNGVSVDEDLQEWIRQTHGIDSRGNTSRVIVSPAADKIDYKMLCDLVAAILRGGLGPKGASARDDGAILVFLPGHAEIERALGELRRHAGVGEQRAWLLPLHGSMNTNLQRRVFERAPSNLRKVVLGTNIAETSITIEDVTHVIDCGQVKESRYDPRSRMAVLTTCFVSRAAAQQRTGRAGRVGPGICWRLYDVQFFDRQLPEYTLCEMRRTALEELVLQLRLLNLGSHPGEFLRRAPEPPSPAALEAALRTLVQIGALGSASEGLPLTPLGFHLAHMPMDVRTAKMLLYGSLMRCLSPMLTIAACLSHKSPFTRGFGKGREDTLRQVRDDAFGEQRSDHLAVVEAFEGWRKVRITGWTAEREYCDKYGLSISTLSSMQALRERFARYLQEVGFASDKFDCRLGVGVDENSSKTSDKLQQDVWDPDANANDHDLLRCVLCAGLYPNVAQIQRRSGGKCKGSSMTFLISAGDLDRCAVHPGSLNARRLQEMQANHGWLLYHTKVKTSQVFLHDSTLIGSIPLLLFGGGDLSLARDRKTMVVDSTLRFDGRREETAVLLKLLRREVDRLLLLKIANPTADISKTAEPLLRAVAELLRLEGGRGVRRRR